MTKTTIKLITVEELFHKHTSITPEDLILDVRTSEEFQEGHIPGSINISHESVPNQVGELQKYKRVYLYCRSGARATFVAQVLMQAGFEETFLVASGGMPDWIMSGYPVER